MKRQSSQTDNYLWTSANIVTIIRAVFIPLWIIATGFAVPSAGGTTLSLSSLLLALFYMVLSATDTLDGYLARSRNEVTVFGKFLDPIADKLVVITALLYLLECGLVSIWMVFIIIAREFIVSGIRMVVASGGTVIAASNLGKYKTAATMVSISCYLVWLALPACTLATCTFWAALILMYIAVFLTAWSGIDYVVKSKDFLLRG